MAGFAVVLGVRVRLCLGVAGVVVDMVRLVVGVRSVAIVEAGVMGSRVVAGLVAEPACRRIDDVLVAGVFVDGLLRTVFADRYCRGRGSAA